MDLHGVNDVTDMSYGLMTELAKLGKLEERVKQKSKGRQLAKALHEQADLLYSKGDYETALVLYHRAASKDPRDTSHKIAAHTTSKAISLATSTAENAKGTHLQKVIQTMIKNNLVLPSTLCTPNIIRKATKILSRSPDPFSDVSNILECLDSRVNFSEDCVKNVKLSKAKSKTRIRKLASSKMTLKQQPNQHVNLDFRFVDIKRSFADGDWDKTIEISRNLLQQKQILNNSNCVVNVYRYAALAFVAKKRHDHAVVQVSKMIQAAKQSNNVKLVSRSLAVLGKVHLTFGHVYATAIVWERLNSDIAEPILKAWLLHEIGRCYFEMSHFTKALELARRCVSCSERAQSGKWICYGKLLAGQALVQLGQLTRALEYLKLVVEIAGKEINDDHLVSYLQNLIKRIYIVQREKFNRRNPSGIENAVKPLEGMKKNAEILKKVNDKLNQQSVNKNNRSHFVDKWKRALTESKSSMIKSDSGDSFSSNVVTKNDFKTRQVFLVRHDLENETEKEKELREQRDEDEKEQEQEKYSLATLSDKMSPGLTKLESSKLSCIIKVRDNKKLKLEESLECFEMAEDQSDKSISTNRTYDITCSSTYPLYSHSIPGQPHQIIN